ncbi:MAG: rubredoxin [Promethearchaeota archaeon]
MAKYICDLCGWEYDEDAEGKPWSEVPDDFTCPVCGATKDQFSPA